MPQTDGRNPCRVRVPPFFHIWRRDGGAPTAGCTAMSEENLRAMIAWLDPSRHPLYILLPAREYLRLRRAWGLP